MSLQEQVIKIEEQNKQILSLFVKETEKGSKVKKSVVRKVRRGLNKGRVLVPWFGANKEFSFREAHVDGGLVYVGEDSYAFDPSSVYLYKKGRVPVIGLLEWRLSPVGGAADRYKVLSTGSQEDVDLAEKLKDTAHGQKTIIRRLEQFEADPEKKKKKGKMPLIWIIIGVVVALALLSQFLGGA